MTMTTKFPYEVLVCPTCHSSLIEKGTRISCEHCHSFFDSNEYGFWDMATEREAHEIQPTDKAYADHQKCCGIRVYEEFLRPLLVQEPCHRVLDVGCGVGKEVRLLIEDGYDAYGIDIPQLSQFWSQSGNSPQHFFSATGTGLPFPNDFFDVVYSFGVIEHIGTRTGHCTLTSNYRDARQQYANEILRVVKPRGRIIIACPNKSFPIDIQHDPGDELCSPNEIRKWIYRKTGLNIHRVWGKYHLLSHNEMRMLFGQEHRLAEFKPLGLKGYFGFGRFQKGFLRPFARLASLYVEHLPKTLQSSPFNPYVLVEMRKLDKSL